MKQNVTLRSLLVAFIVTLSTGIFAQTKEDIFGGDAEITWLGLDFSKTKFIGDASQFKDAGTITPKDFKDKYTVAWNALILKEPKKFDVAGAVRRTEVKYATEVTESANSKITQNFFTDDVNDFAKLTEKDISTAVSKYDFKGKTGIGMMFFVEGMSKDKSALGAWVTYVDMKSKKVIFTEYYTGKPGGIGFRNFWAKSFAEILKDVKDNFKKNKK